jgi:hypothetical protein
VPEAVAIDTSTLTGVPFLVAILTLVVYLARSRRDQTPARVLRESEDAHA